ncbi:probable serine/threonine-protein kinase at1g54610 [Phtheirospermum japonicum]|uniref:Probable serine/threonine-protein kinase at1g54610 n=1 Tax=Phtheirospermum japonicum TaxID=374723 RepID=A0A830BCB9_9LAMI|nr:probable serine/threonine-protein kinase at1g54610 [Phtheirospermum japonicum]
MGCVLGRESAGKRKARRNQKPGERRDSEPAPAATLRNGVADRGKEKKIEFPAETAVAMPEFRLRRGVSSGGEGWPSWLNDVAGQAIKDWKPRRANTFEKLDKIGQGTYSNVYKARDLITGKVVALKKVRFDNLEPETVKFMAREILVLRRLNHPNVIKLEGLVISRMSSSLYLVFEYMEHDLAGLAAVQTVKFTEPQHCHNNGVLHRDIKCSNLLIGNDGVLRIADFGLASFFDPECKRPMTSRVITLWYRPPELLLGATYYGVGVDLWSAGCILAELLSGKPILRGRTEVEQLHKIFKLCGSPSEEYWKKSRLPNATLYKPQQPYKRCIAETFKDFPSTALALIENLLSVDPDARGTATSALNSEVSLSSPMKAYLNFLRAREMDIKLRDEEARRQRGLNTKPHSMDGNRRARPRDKISRAMPAPEANAELQTNLDRMRIMSDAKAKSKSDKFPPPHQDAAAPHDASQMGGQASFGRAADTSFTSSIFDRKSSRSLRSSMASRMKNEKDEPQRAPSRSFINALYPSSVVWDFRFNRRRTVSENFRERR